MTTFDIENASSNLIFNHSKNMARRMMEFNNSVVTTKDSIKPGQLFSIKVLEVDETWDGNLRIGFTILPDGILFPLARFRILFGILISILMEFIKYAQMFSIKFYFCEIDNTWYDIRTLTLRYSIPDMCDRGGNWICAIDNEVEMEKSSQRDLQSSFKFEKYQNIVGCKFEEKQPNQCKCCLSTSYGTVPLYQLMSECFNNNGEICKSHKPAMVESIISIYYDVTSVPAFEFEDNSCVLEAPYIIECDKKSPASDPTVSFDRICFKYTFHVLVNGIQVNVHEDLVYVTPPKNGYFPTGNPYNYLPFVRAIVDVYGSTKSVQIINFEQNQIKSLQGMCIHEMIKNCGYTDITKLPKSLKNYLQIQLHKLLFLED